MRKVLIEKVGDATNVTAWDTKKPDKKVTKSYNKGADFVIENNVLIIDDSNNVFPKQRILFSELDKNYGTTDIESFGVYLNENGFFLISEFIYTTDGKSYESLSSAMVVVPLPENNTIFYIDEDNLTERGMYAYDSSEVSGYRFVRNYTPNGIVEQGNTQAVNGGKVYSSITKWNNDINISDIYGGTNYTLQTAIAKLTPAIAKVGLIITFRSSAIITESYRLVGVTTGGYASYYLNPANYIKIYYKSDIDKLQNEINLTTLYGGRHTLATAVPLVTSEFGKLGLKITFRTVSGSANAVETWQLVGNVAGSYPTFYNNPDNYVRVPIRTEVISWINEINISKLFPTGGTAGDFRYTLSGAIAKIPTEFVKVGMKVTFRTDLGVTTQTWVLVKSALGGYSSYHLNPDNYERVPERFEFDKLGNDYNSNTNNRLANILFESRDTWNAKNPTNQIESITIMTGNPTTGNYRIPCSIITNAGTILAASELRPINSPGDYGDFSIELYRKTVGGTVTNTIPLPFNYAGLGRFMDPSFVIDRNGSHGPAGRIYLFAGAFKKHDVWDTNSTAEADYIYITSDDDGVTWSTHTSVKSKWDLSNYTLAIPAPNNGIQLTNGSLVIPSFTNRGSLILVKEVGQDWYFSKEVFGPSNSGRIDECTVVEIENEIVLVGRNNKNYADYPHRGERVFKYDKTSNGWILEESTFSVNRSNQLSICKAVIAGRTLYLKTFTDSNTTDRRNLTLWVSVDLKTWIRIYRIYNPGGNGYSSINYYNNRIIVSHETSTDILFQELTPLLGLITDSIMTNLESNISVQDRMQMIINMFKGI